MLFKKNKNKINKVFDGKKLPPGTLHINLEGIKKVCKKLKIQFAEAVVGFELSSFGRTIPTKQGVVIFEKDK